MNFIVPTIFILAIIIIFIYMIFEIKKEKRIEKIKQQKEEEQRFLIEKRIMRDVTFCEEYWLKNGSFNREQYGKYLEAKEEFKS